MASSQSGIPQSAARARPRAGGRRTVPHAACRDRLRHVVSSTTGSCTMFLSWLRNWTTRRPRTARPARRPDTLRRRPRLEALEDRVVLNSTDLGITLTGQPGTLVPGALLTYTINVTNNGPQDTSGSPTVT